MCENEFLSGPIQVNRVTEREKGAPVSSLLAQRVLRKHKALNEDRAPKLHGRLRRWEKTQFCSKQHASQRHRANLLRATVCFQSTDVLHCDDEKCWGKKLRQWSVPF